MKKTLLLAGVACLFASQANAEGYFFKPYLGLDYVHSWGKYEYDNDKDEKKITKSNVSAGAASLGFQFHHNLGLELFYQQSAEAKKSYGNGSFIKTGYNFYDLKSRVKYNAYGMDLIGYIPTGNSNLNALLSIGTGRYKIKAEYTWSDDEYYWKAEESESKWGVRVGGGFQYFFNDKIAGRIMARYTYVGSNDVDFEKMIDVTAGIRFYF